jgi:hypothetical protein
MKLLKGEVSFSKVEATWKPPENALGLRCILRLRLTSYCREMHDLSSSKNQLNMLYIYIRYFVKKCVRVYCNGV